MLLKLHLLGVEKPRAALARYWEIVQPLVNGESLATVPTGALRSVHS